MVATLFICVIGELLMLAKGYRWFADKVRIYKQYRERAEHFKADRESMSKQEVAEGARVVLASFRATGLAFMSFILFEGVLVLSTLVFYPFTTIVPVFVFMGIGYLPKVMPSSLQEATYYFNRVASISLLIWIASLV